MFALSHPVWARGRSREINLHLEFDIVLPSGAQTVRLTASTAYQLFADDAFIAYGPARAGDGYFRVDEWRVDGKARLTVLVAGYYSSCFEYSLYPSFLNLEVLDAQGAVLLATGRDAIAAFAYAPKLRWTDKQARQRVYTEVFDFNRRKGERLELETLPDPHYLPRRVAPFSNAVFVPVEAMGDLDITLRTPTDPRAQMPNGRSPFNNNILFLNPDCGVEFPQMECRLFEEAWRIATVDKHPAGTGALTAMHARLFKFDANRSALIGLDVDVQSPCEICLIFDEMLIDGDVIPRRSNCLNAIKYTLPAGEHRLLSFEPYTFRYLKVCVLKGSVALRRVYMREIAGVEIARVEFRDARIQEIFDAAVNTYRQNASDIFMDCPSRERAGWLCDSFFTGRSEYALTGDNRVETNFLENYAYHTNYFLPKDCSKGLVPMLYPGSTDFMPDRAWIFNWNLWLILEIGEYALLRHGSQALIGALKDMVYAILDAAFGWENEEGLLEDIPGWVFVEWSRANDPECTCGVNFPSNMLFSGALEAAGRLYGDKRLLDKAEALRDAIRKYGFNGRFFVDNAVRVDGRLTQTQHTTEVCQYYAFCFKVADAKRYPALHDLLLNDFGPQRKADNKHPDVPFANAFIGNYLRMLVLMDEGCYERALREIGDYFGYMARETASLWEFDDTRASCCHGFASCVAVWLMQLKEKLDL